MKKSIFLFSTLFFLHLIKGNEPSNNKVKLGLIGKQLIKKQELEKEDSKIKLPVALFSFPVSNEYSPISGIQAILEKCIINEKSKIRGAYYTFGLTNVADSIVSTIRNNSLSATLIVDEDELTDQKARGKRMQKALNVIYQNKGEIRVTNKKRISVNGESMHHKFMIFDHTDAIDGNTQQKKIVITGSWNASQPAEQDHWENVVILNDLNIIKAFEEEFNRLCKYSKVLTVEPSKYTKGEPEILPEKPKENAISQLVYFSPGIKNSLDMLIEQEKEKIRIAMEIFELDGIEENFIKIAKTIGEKNNSESVILIVDKGFNNDRYKKEALCKMVQAPYVRAYKNIYQKMTDNSLNQVKSSKYQKMHHKFILFNNVNNKGPLIWTGSYNITNRAEERNWENVVILNDSNIIGAFKEEWEILLASSEELKKEEIVSSSPKRKPNADLIEKLKTMYLFSDDTAKKNKNGLANNQNITEQAVKTGSTIVIDNQVTIDAFKKEI